MARVCHDWRAWWRECDRAGIVMVTGTVKSLGLVSHNLSTNLLETIKGKTFWRYSSGIESTVHYSTLCPPWLQHGALTARGHKLE